ncbi:MAG: hypothetical protein VW405_05860 [Rhodospirillaceae bacterium]
MRPAAEGGDVKAQFALAQLLNDPATGFRDPAKAIVWYRKAADQGHIDAQYRLGLLHSRGEGTTVNYHRASE